MTGRRLAKSEVPVEVVLAVEQFKHFEVLDPSEEENRGYQRLLKEKRKLGKGELEAISICKKRGYVFSSMDNAALKFAEENKVEALGLQCY